MELNQPIKIMDGKDVLTISYDDILKYHGHNMIGGVALAYKIMAWGLPKLTDDIPKRGGFYFLSGIGPGGEGVIDAVEMVMRVKTHNALCIDLNKVQDKPGPRTPGGNGRYYFELGYNGKILCEEEYSLPDVTRTFSAQFPSGEHSLKPVDGDYVTIIIFIILIY